MSKKILVIEDDPKHRRDAEMFFGRHPETKVVYALDYYAATDIMFKDGHMENGRSDIDGVMSDIYFPLSDDPKWNQPEPIGVRAAIEMSQVGIPFVLNTAGYHHGRKYQWIFGLAQRMGWPLVDPCQMENLEWKDYETVDASLKDWKRAYKTLLEKLK